MRLVRERGSRVRSVWTTVAEELLLLLRVLRVVRVSRRSSLRAVPVVLNLLLRLLAGRVGGEDGTALGCRRVRVGRSDVRSVEVRLLMLMLRGRPDELLRELCMWRASTSCEVGEGLLLLSGVEGDGGDEDVGLRRLIVVQRGNKGELMRLRNEGLSWELREGDVRRVRVRPSLLLLLLMARARIGIVGVPLLLRLIRGRSSALLVRGRGR